MHKTVVFLVFHLYFVCLGADEIYREVVVNVGRNLTVPCPIHRTTDVMWVKQAETNHSEKLESYRMVVFGNGSMFLNNVTKNDTGVYVCYRQNVVHNDLKALVKIEVKTPPPALVNVVVKPSTILALILWEVAGNGGYPIINFTAQYRLADNNTSWLPISPNHITPNSRQIEVYKLVPNTTYQFRIWATNQIGRGQIVEIYGTTKDNYNEMELARHLLDGADKFDTRVWAIAAGIVMGTLILLGLGTCFLLYQELRVIEVTEEQEDIELVPNIILNPGFDPSNNNDRLPDENSNNETPLRLNNNTVIQPNVT